VTFELSQHTPKGYVYPTLRTPDVAHLVYNLIGLQILYYQWGSFLNQCRHLTMVMVLLHDGRISLTQVCLHCVLAYTYLLLSIL
jgi:hypothetical protein